LHVFSSREKLILLMKNIIYDAVFTMEKSQNDMNISQKYIKKKIQD
jgi:hypothetical protein